MTHSPLLPQIWNVPDVFRKRLGTTAGKQRAMHEEGHLLLILHVPPEPDEKSRKGRLLWRDPAGNWRGSDTGSGVVAVKKHLDQYAAVIDAFEQAEESAFRADEYLPLLEGLAPVLRAVRNLEQVMQDARDLLPDDRNLIDFRDQSYELARTADLLYTDLKNGMEVAIIRRAEQQALASEKAATAANRFNLLVAFFFPIGTLAGIFGVNLRNGLEHVPAPWPIIGMLLTGVLCGTLLAIHINRGSKA